LPMVPILTSVVLGGEQPKSGASRRGFILSSVYVAGMAITYAIAGVIAGMLGAGANIQAWMQTPWVLSLFAAMFVVLSLSMFGLYELQLPSFLRNRLNAVSQKQTGGQIASVGLMGILSALVVSPCVSAPLVGALSYISLTGDATLGGLALLALGLGMGTPLIILGTTGAKILPKAGAWMEKTKVFFGVMLLAVAIWLLGRILPGPAYLFLWAALALGYGVQLGALEPASSGAQRLLRAIGLMLVIYGVAAAWGAFKGNSDPLLPLQTHGTESRARLFQQTDSITQVKQWIESSDQPIMLDLYADWCISCKVMEDEIFSDADVQSRLSGYRWIQLDLTEQTDEQVGFLQDFALFGPPTVLFFANGQEIQSSRITGEASKDEFLAYIEQRLP
ncbi:MAG: protein-disulfide reductase DsbD, partial [Oceanobacter sp.]